jgi:hypothetical protein
VEHTIDQVVAVRPDKHVILSQMTIDVREDAPEGFLEGTKRLAALARAARREGG